MAAPIPSSVKLLDLAADGTRITGRVLEWLDDLEILDGALTELSGALSDLGDTAETLHETVESWQEASGEDKRDLREEALDALGAFAEAWNAVDYATIPDSIKALIAGAGLPED